VLLLLQSVRTTSVEEPVNTQSQCTSHAHRAAKCTECHRFCCYCSLTLLPLLKHTDVAAAACMLQQPPVLHTRHCRSSRAHTHILQCRLYARYTNRCTERHSGRCCCSLSPSAAVAALVAAAAQHRCSRSAIRACRLSCTAC
jgi:hypothetical protein